MLAEHFAAAAAAVRTIRELDYVAALTWKAWGEGQITDMAAEAVSRAVQARKDVIRSVIAGKALRPSSTPPRRKERRRPESIARRRRLAASGALPAGIAAAFTQGEAAVLTVVAREVKRRQRCELPLDAIAAMAGVCRTLAKEALRRAGRLGLIQITERPRRGHRSDTNSITISSAEWQVWLRLGRDRGQKSDHHGKIRDSKQSETALEQGRSEARPSRRSTTSSPASSGDMGKRVAIGCSIRRSATRLPGL